MYNYFKIDALVKAEKSFKGFSIFLLWWPSCSMEQNGLSNFGRQSPKEHSSGSHLVLWPRTVEQFW